MLRTTHLLKVCLICEIIDFANFNLNFFFSTDIDSDVIMSMKHTPKGPISTTLEFNFSDEDDEDDDETVKE